MNFHIHHHIVVMFSNEVAKNLSNLSNPSHCSQFSLPLAILQFFLIFPITFKYENCCAYFDNKTLILAMCPLLQPKNIKTKLRSKTFEPSMVSIEATMPNKISSTDNQIQSILFWLFFELLVFWCFGIPSSTYFLVLKL